MTESETPDDDARRYWVTYRQPAGYGGRYERSHKTVKCASITVTDGLVRFRDADGADVWTIQSSRVLEYEDQTHIR